MKHRLIALLSLTVFLFSAAPSFAAGPDFPVRPIQVIVPYSAGGGTDIAIRVLADMVKKNLPQGFVVINKVGGGGSIGTSAVSHAKPDGYTLGGAVMGPVTMMSFFGGLDYTVKDFDFIGLICKTPIVLAAGKKAPFNTIQELITYAKANPGKISIGNPGAGALNHLLAERFCKVAGIQAKHMPYDGSSKSIPACIGGHIDLVVAHPVELLNHVKAGNMKPLAVFEEKRLEEFPDTPTCLEVGIDHSGASWKGVIAPKGLPADVKKVLVDAVGKTIQDPAFIKKMKDLGETVTYMNSEEMQAMAFKDAQNMEEVIRALGMYGINEKKKK
ncbi:tripartite tricarboxylate transporter substrate binding protein [Desulfovibrio sp. OttesenSCG-928-O18]|nr:tripartite tricarboxylate transporter substrate binding protein [Desulfovibrio sp. OttesenSCG-928-O18]